VQNRGVGAEHSLPWAIELQDRTRVYRSREPQVDSTGFLYQFPIDEQFAPRSDIYRSGRVASGRLPRSRRDTDRLAESTSRHHI